MMQVILSTLESKLRRVENLDRAVQHLMRKFDSLERIVESNYVAAAIVREEEAAKAHQRFSNLDAKLDKLVEKFDSVCEEEETELLEDIIALPSIRRSRIFVPPPPNDHFDGATPQSTFKPGSVLEAVEDMRGAVEGMDRRLAFHINIVAENMGKMKGMIRDVHGAVIEQDEDDVFGRRRNSSSKKISKFERLNLALQPLAKVSVHVHVVLSR